MNPASYFDHVKDVAAEDKADILCHLAQHYVREAEVSKARVATECALKVLEESEGRRAVELRKQLKKLLDGLAEE